MGNRVPNREALVCGLWYRRADKAQQSLQFPSAQQPVEEEIGEGAQGGADAEEKETTAEEAANQPDCGAHPGRGDESPAEAGQQLTFKEAAQGHAVEEEE